MIFRTVKPCTTEPGDCSSCSAYIDSRSFELLSAVLSADTVFVPVFPYNDGNSRLKPVLNWANVSSRTYLEVFGEASWFLIGPTFLREPCWKYSAKLVGSQLGQLFFANLVGSIRRS